ncbi:DUF3383 domain-containing protein [Bradyrhizobium sp. Pear76]|uniref:DUF3383 family protein n=1 Tax=Bradyrhizobium oropedii TaxID=1571201 RepID=UPI001E29178E|nr:DUF3383 family protein [Bradyrhizobium oropedii]MCC8963774.1 DUF3383 domain-containing protein [Bradyrhizobium oropedii]
MGTIDASQLVSVTPSVLAAGGSAVDIIGLVLTSNTRAPLGQVLSFPSAAAVQSYFGPTSKEAQIAGGGAGLGSGYFGGFTGSNKLPANILFAQYNTAAVGAYLRGGSVSALSIAQLQAINGTLSVTINGVAKAGTVNLAAATSFTNAATIIADMLDIESASACSFTGSITTNQLTVTAVTTGTLAVGQFVDGPGVTAGTYITAFGTGSGGNGTYTVSQAQTLASEALTSNLPGVTFDSISGAFVVSSPTTGAASTLAYATGTAASALGLTQANGAVLSQGAVAAVPAAFMNALIAQNNNWVTFMTAFDPDGGAGNTQKQAFAAWKNGKNNRYAYVCWDADITPTQSVPATASLGYILANNNDSGTFLQYEPTDLNQAAFICGAAASIDFSQTNGRISFAYKSQAGLVAGVTDPTVATNLGGNPQATDRGNGYNFYGAYANANQNFVWEQRGFVTGPFQWFDSYINQIWFNSFAQSALLNLLNAVKSVPYDAAGRALMEAALATPINAALNYGMFGPGTLTSAEAAAVNAQAGAIIAPALQTSGYYLQILTASPTARIGRTTPPATFWYLDVGAVQSINLASVALQ